jgi:uncharacterized protein YdeI (YjbR/CyaY-like superfamily)
VKSTPKTRRAQAFADPAEFRAWLERNRSTAVELYVRCAKAQAKRGLTYRQALDEALCLGWIDGVRHAVDETSFSVRFSPRKPRSAWSTVNIRRFLELQAQGRVAPDGLAAYEARVKSQYSFETRPQALAPAYVRAFRANPRAWTFFSAQPPWYRRTCSFYVMSAKQPETRARRLALLVKQSARGQALSPILKLPSTRARGNRKKAGGSK